MWLQFEPWAQYTDTWAHQEAKIPSSGAHIAQITHVQSDESEHQSTWTVMNLFCPDISAANLIRILSEYDLASWLRGYTLSDFFHYVEHILRCLTGKNLEPHDEHIITSHMQHFYRVGGQTIAHILNLRCMYLSGAFLKS